MLPIIEVRSGISFDFLNPTPDMIELTDIAWGLAHQCRYAGHVRSFYSIAEHSVIMAKWLESQHYNESVVLAALLHDAAEAYMTDVPTPLKKLLPAFTEIEDRIARLIAAKFGAPYPFPHAVHEADRRIIVNERRALTKNIVVVPNLPEALPNISFKCLAPLDAVVEFQAMCIKLLGPDCIQKKQ